MHFALRVAMDIKKIELDAQLLCNSFRNRKINNYYSNFWLFVLFYNHNSMHY